MLVLSLALFIIPSLFGVAIVAAFKVFPEKTALTLLGTVGGLACTVSLTYLLTILFPFNLILLSLIILGLGLVTGLIFYKTSAWSNWQQAKLDQTAVTVLVIALLIFSVITPKLLFEKDGGLQVGIINAWGDIGWHVANITSYAQGQTFPLENPILAGTRLTYPFLSNFFSSMLVVSGATISQAVVWPALVLIPVLLTLLYSLTQQLTSRRLAGLIVVLLFLFGGATLGFTRIANDFLTSNQSLPAFILNLPDRDYSGVGTDLDGYHFLNPTFTLLLPQRPFIFGLPLALSILLLLVPPADNKPILAKRLLFAGILSGLLPLFHAHSVLALIPAIIAFYIIRPSPKWGYFFLPAIAIGLPGVIYYLTGDGASGSFFRWSPRWMAGDHNLISYWFKNTGIIIPVVIFGLLIPARRIGEPHTRSLKALATAGLLLFTAANLWLFAPWAWDNFKLIVYWFIFSLPLVAYLAIKVTQRYPQRLVKLIVIFLVAFHTFSGALDLWKISLPTATVWQEWNAPSIQVAQAIQAATEPGQSILTAPIHNSTVALAGRPLYLGYAAHVWSHGGDPWAREDAIAQLYTQDQRTLPETTPDYILVGPDELLRYPQLTIRSAWQPVLQLSGYTLYLFPPAI